MTLLEKIENKLEEMEDFYPSKLIEEAILFAGADKSADEQIKTIVEHLQSSVICLDWKESLDGNSLNSILAPFGVSLKTVWDGDTIFVQARPLCACCGNSMSQLEANAASAKELAEQ